MGSARVRAHILGNHDKKAVPFKTITQAQQQALNTFVKLPQVPREGYSSDNDPEDHFGSNSGGRDIGYLGATANDASQDSELEHVELPRAEQNENGNSSDSDFADCSGSDTGSDSDMETNGQVPGANSFNLNS